MYMNDFFICDILKTLKNA